MLQIIQEKSIFCALASERITTHAVAAHLLNISSVCLIQATSGRAQEIEESQREHLHASASHRQPPTHLWEQPSIIPPTPTFRWGALMCVSDSCCLLTEHPSLHPPQPSSLSSAASMTSSRTTTPATTRRRPSPCLRGARRSTTAEEAC